MLSGCGHRFAAGPNLASGNTFDQDAARCRLMSRNNGGGFGAAGTPAFVSSAALGYALGSAINRQETFNDCMLAVGYVYAK